MTEKVEKQKKSNLEPRPPIVVVLGHVDHGKTSILDYVRKNYEKAAPGGGEPRPVAGRESGGITQHIGAYQIEHQGKKITFIDTPGHEAFSAMRSRGAKVADIAILVVAAEEGLKPQTKEALSHIKKTGIPMIVAINKIDKTEANPDKIKRELAQAEISVESMGGQVPSVGTSAKTGQGIEELLELILLVAEMEKFEGDIGKPGEGVVIEAYLDSHRGPTSTLLLRDGVLKTGDIVGTRSTCGKIKILEDFQGKPLEEAIPSSPCVVLGFEKVPQVGEKFEVYSNIESAREYIKKKEKKDEKGEVFFVEEGKKVLNLILKADVAGSLEAVEEVLKSLPQDKVVLRIIRGGVGELQEADIKLAKSALAKILGFRVKTNPIAVKLADRDNVKVMNFEVIYELAQAVRQLMERALGSENVRINLGKIKALVIFRSEKNRQVVGGKVTEGEVKKGVSIEVFRGEEFVGKGRLINLQRNKKDVEKTVRGDECGILYEGDAKIEEGDMLQIYETKSARQSID